MRINNGQEVEVKDRSYCDVLIKPVQFQYSLSRSLVVDVFISLLLHPSSFIYSFLSLSFMFSFYFLSYIFILSVFVSLFLYFLLCLFLVSIFMSFFINLFLFIFRMSSFSFLLIYFLLFSSPPFPSFFSSTSDFSPFTFIITLFTFSQLHNTP